MIKFHLLILALVLQAGLSFGTSSRTGSARTLRHNCHQLYQQVIHRHGSSNGKPAGTHRTNVLSLSGGGIDMARFDDKTMKDASDALQSVKYCSKSLIGAALFRFFINISEIQFRQFRWTMPFIAERLKGLSLIGFGVGLYRVSMITEEVIEKKMLGLESIHHILSRMSRVWLFATGSVMGFCMLPATHVANHISTNMLVGFGSVWIALSSLLYHNCLKLIPLLPSPSKKKEVRLDNHTVRVKGLLVIRYMVIFESALLLLALLQFATIMTSHEGIIKKIYGLLTNPLEKVIIARLVSAMMKRYALAVVDATEEHSVTDHEEVFDGLFKAQKGFYDKIGKTAIGIVTAEGLKRLVFFIQAARA